MLSLMTGPPLLSSALFSSLPLSFPLSHGQALMKEAQRWPSSLCLSIPLLCPTVHMLSTQAGRGSLACTLHLHVALPPQNNRPSNLMRLRYEEAWSVWCVCVCVLTREDGCSASHWERLIFPVLVSPCFSPCAVSLSDPSP